MNKTMKTLLIGIGFLGGMFLLGYFGCSKKGIVTIQGYEHAVGFCKGRFEGVVYLKGATYLGTPEGHIVVNLGHEKDQQVVALKTAMTKTCKGL